MASARRHPVMLEIAVAMVRQRWPMFAGSFVALALGTTILATSIITLAATSATGLGKARSVAQVTTALSVMVVVFVLTGIFAFLVDQRARDLALLSLLGTSPRRIRRLIRTETLVVGFAAGLMGCLFGMPGAWLLRRWLVVNDIAPRWYHVGFHPGALVIAFLVGLVAALLGTSPAAWRASRAEPLDALREAAASTRIMTPLRWTLGAVILAGAATVAVAIGVVSPRNAATPGSFFEVPVLCAVGVALLAPPVTRPITRLFTRPLIHRGAVALAIRQGALNGGLRIAALVAPVALAVGMFTGMLAMESTGAAATGTLAASDAQSTRLANVVILGIALIYALVAIANTLVMNVAARSRELTALELLGATRPQIAGVLLGEALAVVTSGALVGMAGAVLSQVLQRLALLRVASDRMIAVPWLGAFAVISVCAATATIAVMLAAWRATRTTAARVSLE